jgi:hypothetical protein
MWLHTHLWVWGPVGHNLVLRLPFTASSLLSRILSSSAYAPFGHQKMQYGVQWPSALHTPPTWIAIETLQDNLHTIMNLDKSSNSWWIDN